MANDMTEELRGVVTKVVFIEDKPRLYVELGNTAMTLALNEKGIQDVIDFPAPYAFWRMVQHLQLRCFYMLRVKATQ